MSVQMPGISPIVVTEEAFPGKLKLGDENKYVQLVKNELNTISINYPEIPKISPTDDVFNATMEDAVKKFQSIFNIPVTGIVDKITWYEIRRIYEAVIKLATSSSEIMIPIEIYNGAIPEPGVNEIFPTIQLAQYFLNVLSAYYNEIPAVDINGTLDRQTQYSIRQFQKVMGLPVTGLLDEETWKQMYENILGILNTLPPSAISLPALIYPGEILSQNSEGANVFIMQLFLSYISSIILSLPPVNTNGFFDEQMTAAVTEFQKLTGINPTGVIDETTWKKIVDVYRQLRFSSYRPIGQYPGTLIVE